MKSIILKKDTNINSKKNLFKTQLRKLGKKMLEIIKHFLYVFSFLLATIYYLSN